jgi:hypothetical protein
MSVSIGFHTDRAMNGSVFCHICHVHLFVAPSWHKAVDIQHAKAVGRRLKIIVLVEAILAVMVASYSDMERG